MADLREARRDALRDWLGEQALDGLLVTHLPNVRYLTGFTGSSAVVAVLPREVLFVSDFRYREQADVEVADAARVEIVAADVWERLWRVLSGVPGLRALGYEAEATTVADAERFVEARERTGCRFEPVRGAVGQLRVRKHPDEVEAIRQAAALAREALEATLASVRPGLRELDVAATLERELRQRGSEWHPFPTIVAAGPRSALPHANTGRRTIAPGDFLLIDFGARLGGYCADLTRTVVVGARADERQRTVYELVRHAQQAARDGLRAGMTGREADAIARQVISSRGFGDHFGHSLGHGLGLEVHEEPRLSSRNEQALPEGAVVTIEPGIYLPGWGGVRIEDDVHLTAGGATLLSDGCTELREIV